MSRRSILVTGGNKGIGLAICKAILKDHADTAVLLGSRDAGRGKAAVSSVISENPSAEGRIEMLLLDTSSDESCKAAAASVTKPLYAIVNNAGIVGETDEMLQVLPLFTPLTPTPSAPTSTPRIGAQTNPTLTLAQTNPTLTLDPTLTLVPCRSTPWAPSGSMRPFHRSCSQTAGSAT